jgi:hypothetical protein
MASTILRIRPAKITLLVPATKRDDHELLPSIPADMRFILVLSKTLLKPVTAARPKVMPKIRSISTLTTLAPEWIGRWIASPAPYGCILKNKFNATIKPDDDDQE